jgi:hypothetical protein
MVRKFVGMTLEGRAGIMRPPSSLAIALGLAAVADLACVKVHTGSLHDSAFVRQIREAACSTENETTLTGPLDPITTRARPELTTGVQLLNLDAGRAELIVLPDDRRSIPAANIREIRVANHNRGALEGLALGALIGVALGLVVDAELRESLGGGSFSDGPSRFGVGTFVVSAALGAFLGAAAGSPEVYRVIPDRNR